MGEGPRFSHTSVSGVGELSAPDGFVPGPGRIALLPEGRVPREYADAVIAAGGELAPLSEETNAVVWGRTPEPDVLSSVLREHPGVRWVQLPLAGINAIADALSESSRDGLVWTSAKGAFAQPVAEHAFALIHAGLRGLGVRARAHTWGESFGDSLYGREVLIVGAGGVAVELIRLLGPFGVSVTVVRRRDGDVAGASRTVTVDRIDEVLPGADVVVLAAASTDETTHLLDARRFAAMKSTAVVVNIARGPLVDTDALVEALRTGKIAFAGLDVTDPEPLPDGHPLWDEPNAIITPHTADTSEMVRPLVAERIRQNTEAFLRTGRFVGVIDPDAGY